MTDEEMQYLEFLFQELDDISIMMRQCNYQLLLIPERKRFWISISGYLLDTYNHVVPGTGPVVIESPEEKIQKELLKKKREAEQLIEQESLFNMAIQTLKDINIQRIYIAEQSTNTCPNCSVLNGLPVQMRSCSRPAFAGSLRFVKYFKEYPNYKTVEFSENLVGLCTSGMGDCIGVTFLIGMMNRESKYFRYGSLVHLPAGNDDCLNWNEMVFNINPNRLRKYSQRNPLFAQVLICVTRTRMMGSMTIRNLIIEKILPLGFAPPQITIYIGLIPGLIVLKDGRFGTVYINNDNPSL